MTVQEIQTMIRQNMVLYRNVAKPLTDKEADLLIATWADALSDVPSAAGKLAFRTATIGHCKRLPMIGAYPGNV